MADDAAIDGCLQSFYMLSPKRVVKLGVTEEVLKEYGLDEPEYVIYFKFQSEIEHLIFISEETEDGTRYMNMEYGPYVELGTGIYAEGGGGRPTPWVYQDSEGNWHHTRGQEPQPYLRPAVKDHAQTYRNILEDELKNG